MKLLIVDDEPDLLDQLAKVLAAQRCDVDTAADGEAALDRQHQALRLHVRPFVVPT